MNRANRHRDLTTQDVFAQLLSLSKSNTTSRAVQEAGGEFGVHIFDANIFRASGWNLDRQLGDDMFDTTTRGRMWILFGAARLNCQYLDSLASGQAGFVLSGWIDPHFVYLLCMMKEVKVSVSNLDWTPFVSFAMIGRRFDHKS